MRREKEKFDRAGARIVLVSMGTPESAEEFRRQFDLPFPVICDPEKALYRAYGLKGGGMFQIFSPEVFLKGLKTIGRGYFPGLPRGDPFQLPGVFLVDTRGKIRFSYFSRDPSDFPSLETILAALPGGNET